MKIASFNIENIFHRDRDLVEKKWSQSLKNWIAELESLLLKKVKGSSDFYRMRELSFLLGFHKSGYQPFLEVRRKRGELYVKQRGMGGLKLGRETRWKGWVRLQTNPINATAVAHKARLIGEVNPDILLLQEVEDRASLCDFNEHYLKAYDYEKVFFIDTNNAHGLGMGILLKGNYHLESFKTHTADQDALGAPLFNTDVQEYLVRLPSGKLILLINAQLVSDEFEKEAAFQKRKKQSERLAEIYRHHRARGLEKIIIAGSLNSVSYCDSLTPILRGTDLRDLGKHRAFRVVRDLGKAEDYHSLGAYRMGVNLKQKDYFLVSPDLYKCITRCSLDRKGIWPRTPGQWLTFPSLTEPHEMASHHPLIWSKFREL